MTIKQKGFTLTPKSFGEGRKNGITHSPIKNFGVTLRRKGGFTLIELLVVIAIIGILSSVVLASLNSARQKSRDTRRVADVKQLQLALELFFDANGEYPWGDETGTGVGSFAILAPTHIASLPTDPSGGTNAYQYQAFTSSTGTACANAAATCVYYHIGAKLEQGAGAGTLLSDRDSELAGLTGDTVDGVSVAANCGSDATATIGTDLCYDVTP